MLRTRHRLLASATLLCCVAAAACSAKKRIASTGPAFYLVPSAGESLLLPPSVSQSQLATEIIQLGVPRSVNSESSVKCSAAEGVFRLAPDSQSPGSLQVILPGPARWLSDLQGKNEPDSSAEVESLDAFLTDVDRLQQAGCFPASGDSNPAQITVRDLILQNLPMRPRESYFNAYDYRLGHSGMDLKPDLRIKIERAYFRPPQLGEQENSIAAFLGLSTTTFEVARDTSDETTFRQSGEIQYSPTRLQSTATEGTHDLSLAKLPPRRRYRLYFYTYLVAEKHLRAAAIIGAPDISQLEALDSQFRANPGQTCTSAPLPTGMTCIDFDGFVTLSTQPRVEMNGISKFIDWGVDVGDLLPKSPTTRELRSLRLQRRFGANEMYEVRFNPKDKNILSLVLVGGDRISWSK